MSRKKWILILTVFMVVAQEQIHATCVCNAKGEDACAKCTRFVRPKPKHPNRPEFELPPIGDNCWCRKASVQPAALPKPCEKFKSVPPTCNSPPVPIAPSYTKPEGNYVQTQVKDDSPPADPISISLAVQAGKAIEVPEAKLSYGFVRTPINRLPEVFISSIREENLYALANEVITWKKPMPTKTKNLEEYPEPEVNEEEEEASSEYYKVPSLTYKQLGYETEEFKSPEFVQISSLAESNPAVYKSGCVTKNNHIRKFARINY